MEVIKWGSGHKRYHRVFKDLKSSQSSLIVWQHIGTERFISKTKMKSYELKEAHMELLLLDDVPLKADQPLYGYIEKDLVIFKTTILHIQNGAMAASMPFEVKLLEDGEIERLRDMLGLGPEEPYMPPQSLRDKNYLDQEYKLMSLEEESEFFADKRQSPRRRSTVERAVKVAKTVTMESKNYAFYDLSRGGLSFLTPYEHEFRKGMEVHVLGFEDFDLDDPLIGTVVSHRPVDETRMIYKVGIKFSDLSDALST